MYNTTILYIYNCKIKHYFPIKQTFSGKCAILEATFNIKPQKQDFGQEKKQV